MRSPGYAEFYNAEFTIAEGLALQLAALNATDKLGAVRALYPAADHPDVLPGQPGWATAALTDMLVTCPTHWFSRHAAAAKLPTWRYLFSRECNLLNQTVQKDLGLVGAYHTLELHYVFDIWFDYVGNIYDVLPGDKAVRDAVQEYWRSIAYTGVPSSKSFSAWPTVAKGSMLNFAADGSGEVMDSDAFRHDKCALFEGIYSDAFGNQGGVVRVGGPSGLRAGW